VQRLVTRKIRWRRDRNPGRFFHSGEIFDIAATRQLFIVGSQSSHLLVIGNSSQRHFGALAFPPLNSSHMRDEPGVARDWGLKIHNLEKGIPS
jgi:hypothetical protein